ncbi:hypothetical protein F443_18556, partial [Phytophthora nicotianae P1569]
MDFRFGLPSDKQGRPGVLVFVDRFSKMVPLAAVAAQVTAEQTASLLLDCVFRHHELPESIVSDRDPRFPSAFWSHLLKLLGTRLLMSTATHPKTDGQTERVNRVLEDVIRSYATSFSSWSDFLALAEFVLNNGVHASSGLTPFFVNNARQPRVHVLLAIHRSGDAAGSALGGGGNARRCTGPLPVLTSRSSGDSRLSTPELGTSQLGTSESTQNLSIRPDHNLGFGSDQNRRDHSPRDLFSRDPLLNGRERSTAPVTNTGAGTRAPGTAQANAAASRTRSKTPPNTSAPPAVVTLANFAPKEDESPINSDAVSELLLRRQAITRFVRDALQTAVDKQKEYADRRGRKNTSRFRRGDRVLLSTDGIKSAAVTKLGANKLAPRYIGPFKVTQVIGDAYMLDIPKAMRLHPTFYVGRLKPYYPATIPSDAHPHQVLARNPIAQHDDAAAEKARGLPPLRCPRPTAPVQTEKRASQPRMRADQQPPQAVEPPVHRLSPDRPPDASGDTGRSSNAPLRRSPRLHENKPNHEARYRRDPPPPLVDAAGNERLIVERLVDHNVRRGRARRSEKHYRVRWLGHSPTGDTWEARSRLLEDVPDVVNDYEASLVTASVTAVAVNDYDPESDFGYADANVDVIPCGEVCCVSPPAPAATAIGRRDRLLAALPRSVARAPVDAPIQRESVDPESQSSSHSLPQ